MVKKSSEYIEKERRDYSLYVMQSRAIPAATDGLKASGRRVLWTARNGETHKTATLAGATMPIHPHASPDGAINTLAAPYGNNIPLFKGKGAFGTLLNPTAYGASRYTSVKVSKFTQEVMFRDIEIIPMQENYDGTLQEPVHFLPLIPVVLLNPSEGIAVGFAANILPRSLEDIIEGQINHLKGKKVLEEKFPKFTPISATATRREETERGTAWYFEGDYKEVDASTICITQLPYGVLHDTISKKLDDLSEEGTIVDVKDKSRDKIEIVVKFKKGFLRTTDRDQLMKLLGLSVRQIENMNVLDFTGKSIWNTSSTEIIRKFTDWRLEWYVKRYERLRDLLQIDLQKYYDVRTAIKHNIGGAAKKIESRAELKELLAEIKIVYVDYIADLPVYRFTEEEQLKNEQKIKEAEQLMKQYASLLSSKEERCNLYTDELKDILRKHTKGYYNE